MYYKHDKGPYETYGPSTLTFPRCDNEMHVPYPHCPVDLMDCTLGCLTVTLGIRTVSKIYGPYVSIVNDGQYQCDSIGHGWKFSPILLERKG